MVVMDALVGSVLFVEFENFVVFANGSGPVVDVVFIKDNNGVALAARDSSADAYTHTNESNGELFAYGSMGGMWMALARVVPMRAVGAHFFSR